MTFCEQVTYSAPGTFAVQFSADAVSTTGQSVHLDANVPIPVATGNRYARLTTTIGPDKPTAGHDVALTLHTTGGPAAQVSYRIDFGDGNQTGAGPQTCQNPTTRTGVGGNAADDTTTFHHAWQQAGIYKLSVRAFEAAGCTDVSGYVQLTIFLTVAP
jgi:hypothetical protein